MLRTTVIANAWLQWADASCTVLLLGRGGREGNPLMASLLEAAGIGGFMLLKIAIVAALLALLPLAQRLRGQQRRGAEVASACLACGMLAVVAWNLSLLLH